MTDFNQVVLYGTLTICAVVVIAIIVFLSKNDKFAQGISDTVDTLYIKTILQFVITTETYSDSSNRDRWRLISNVLLNWCGLGSKSYTSINLTNLLEAIDESIDNTLYSETEKEALRNCVSNLKCKLQLHLPKELKLEDIVIYPSWLSREIRYIVNKL